MHDSAPATRTLSQLLEAVALGDEPAFESFYEQTVRRVYRVALNVIKNPSMAAEIVQEVYLLAWTTAGKYDRSLGSPQTWILTLAHRRAVDRVRSEQSSSERGARHALEMKALKHDSLDETVHRSLMAESVRRCLSSLTDHQAEAIRLAYYGGLTYVEVAEALNLKVPTAKSRIQSGLTKLRLSLEGEGYDAHSR